MTAAFSGERPISDKHAPQIHLNLAYAGKLLPTDFRLVYIRITQRGDSPVNFILQFCNNQLIHCSHAAARANIRAPTRPYIKKHYAPIRAA